MGHDLLTVGVNTAVMLLSLFLLIISLRERKVLTSADAWRRMMSDESHIQKIFLLFSLSLLTYLISESAELMSDISPSISLFSIHHYGEGVHMFFALGALILAVQILRNMLEEGK